MVVCHSAATETHYRDDTSVCFTIDSVFIHSIRLIIRHRQTPIQGGVTPMKEDYTVPPSVPVDINSYFSKCNVYGKHP